MTKVMKTDPDAFKTNQEKKVIDTSKKVKIGIIGTGWISGSHIEAYLDQPDVEIVAAADLVEGKAQEMMDKYGIEGVRCYNSHKELIDNEPDIDAVSICTYNRTHAECTIYALEHGVHVLVEKPMCVTLEEAVEMRRAEKKSGKILSIGFQPRFDENLQMVKKIVQSGELGQVYYIQTGGGRRKGIPTPFGTTFIEENTAGIGALGDIGCYSLDLVLNAVGYPKPLTVTGYASDFFGKDPNYYAKKNHPEYADIFGVDDFGAGFIRLEGGIILDFRIAWAMHLDSPGDTIIMGTNGSLRIPATECWNGGVKEPMTIYHDVAGECVETKVPVIKGDFGDLFNKKIRSFLDAIKEGGKAPISSEEIIINQAIIDGIIKSNKLGREIEIEIPEL